MASFVFVFWFCLGNGFLIPLPPKQSSYKKQQVLFLKAKFVYDICQIKKCQVMNRFNEYFPLPLRSKLVLLVYPGKGI